MMISVPDRDGRDAAVGLGVYELVNELSSFHIEVSLDIIIALKLTYHYRSK